MKHHRYIEPAGESSRTAITEKRIQAAHVRALCGDVSDMWLWRRLKGDPTFPRPCYIARRRFWREADVLAWLAAQPQHALADAKTEAAA